MKRETRRQRFAWWLRMLGDRISPDTGPRAVGATFTIEGRLGNPQPAPVDPGPTFRHDGLGCPLWYMAEDYHLAHDEADTEHTVVLWKNLESGDGPKTRRAGGRR